MCDAMAGNLQGALEIACHLRRIEVFARRKASDFLQVLNGYNSEEDQHPDLNVSSVDPLDSSFQCLTEPFFFLLLLTLRSSPTLASFFSPLLV